MTVSGGLTTMGILIYLLMNTMLMWQMPPQERDPVPLFVAPYPFPTIFAKH
jgi:hypothetical protein